MTRFQPQSHRTSCVPSPWYHLQHYQKRRLVNSSRTPRALEVIGASATSPLRCGIGAKRMVLSLPFSFSLHSFLVDQPLHSSSFRFGDQQVVLQTFYFILERKYHHYCSDSNRHIAGDEGRQHQRMKKQGHSTIAKGCRQRDMKNKNLQALFEDHTRCVHTATMTTQKWQQAHLYNRPNLTSCCNEWTCQAIQFQVALKTFKIPTKFVARRFVRFNQLTVGWLRNEWVSIHVDCNIPFIKSTIPNDVLVFSKREAGYNAASSAARDTSRMFNTTNC